MVKKKETDGQYVKKETMLVVGLVALIVGFLAGVVFSAYKSTPPSNMPPSDHTDHAPQEQNIPNKQVKEIKDLEKEISLHPENLEALIRLGNLYFDVDRPEKAIMAYKKALELDPDNPYVMTDLGVMYRRKGQPSEAIKTFDKAIKIDPRLEPPRFNKGVVLLHDLNDPKGAIRAWEELVEVNPFARAHGEELVVEVLEKLKGRGNPNPGKPEPN